MKSSPFVLCSLFYLRGGALLELVPVDDQPQVGPLADDPLPVLAEDLEEHLLPLDLDDFGGSGDLHPGGHGADMGQVDLRADGGLPLLEAVLHAGTGGLFHQREHDRRGQHAHIPAAQGAGEHPLVNLGADLIRFPHMHILFPFLSQTPAPIPPGSFTKHLYVAL